MTSTEAPTMPEEFLTQYMGTAFWADAIDDGEPVSDDTEWAAEATERARKDCESFWQANWQDVADDPTQAAHDFWLTRNGHGCGFWDGDWDEPQGSRLTAAAERFGECCVYVGDDGLLHMQ